jgi:tetratricopeptide (TPR) repeat protein
MGFPMRERLAILITVVLVASAACTGIKRIERREVPQDKLILSYRLTSEGDKLLEEKKDHLALLKYLEAADLNPYQEVIFNKLAITYSRLLQYDRAKRAAERSLGLKPDYAYAYNTLGIVKLATLDTKGAIRAVNKAIQLRPDVASFYVNLGHAYMQARKYHEARKVYLEALRLDPGAFSQKDMVELSLATGKEPDPERHYQMALFFAESGDKESCLAYMQKALSAGFTNVKRISEEKAFKELRKDEDFRRLLQSYGLQMIDS